MTLDQNHDARERDKNSARADGDRLDGVSGRGDCWLVAALPAGESGNRARSAAHSNRRARSAGAQRPVPAPLPPPPASETPVPETPAPTPLPAQIAAPPVAPAITPVAAPSAAVAFSVPVEGLTRIVDVNQAAHVRPTVVGPTAGRGSIAAAPAAPKPPAAAPPPPGPPPVTHLTLGEGEGRQPPPTYPREAVLARQQGTVGVRFTVGEDGHVISAEVIAPSYPLLNQEALRTIRAKWLFPPGPKRVYEVPIQFQLK